MNILIADDSKASRMFMKSVLKSLIEEELSFCFAEDGEQAVALYQNEMADLVFLDLTMPKKNGMEALREIIHHDASAKVVIVTADAQKVSHDKAMKLGALDYICKPITEEKIERKLHVWLA